MRAAILSEYGATPSVAEFDDPRPGEGQALVDVAAAGLNPVDVSIASGSFYGGSPPLPYVVGREGVGALDDGRRVYFDGPIAPFGSMAERALIDRDSAIEIPDGLDDGLAVAFGIAGLAAWLGLEWRGELKRDETALVLGASGVVGQVAVQAARLLGASRVVAVARSAERLERARELGADATVQIGPVDDLTDALRDATDGGADVVLDPLWGEPAVAALAVVNGGGRFVNLGQSAGATASIASAAIRGKPLSLLGHTNFAAPQEVKHAAYRRMADYGAAGELVVDVERIPLDQVGEAWERQSSSPHRKQVMVP